MTTVLIYGHANDCGHDSGLLSDFKIKFVMLFIYLMWVAHAQEGQWGFQIYEE